MTHYAHSDAKCEQTATNPQESQLEQARANFRSAAAWLESWMRSPQYGRYRHVMLRQALDEYDAAFAALERALRKYEEAR